MPGHFARFIAEHDSPGLVLVLFGASIGEIIDGLVLAWLNWTPKTFVVRRGGCRSPPSPRVLRTVEKGRIRARHHP